MRRNSRCVRSSPYLRPKLDTISDTTRPAPKRFAWRRTNQLPMPASGARTSRFSSSCPPSVQGSFRERIRPLSLASVALPDEAQPGQRQQVIGLVDLVAERRDRAREAAGCDGHEVVADVLAQPSDDAVDLAGEAVDDARLDR